MSQGKPYGVRCDSARDQAAEIFPGTLGGLIDAMVYAMRMSKAGAAYSLRSGGAVLRRYQGGEEVRDGRTARS